MIQSTGKEREAKNMPSPHRYFSACWKPELLQRGVLIADNKPVTGAGEQSLDSFPWASKCPGECAGKWRG